MEQTLGKRIMHHRKRLGLTQDQLAEKCGVTAQAVSKWENDQSCPDINMLPRLAELGRRAVEEQGYDYPVSAALESHWFPTKTYDDFALPAGYYTALQIVIGAGEGENWWCVVFPPLCLDSVGQTVEQAAAAGRFSQKQTALITGETQGYVLKFKAVELWQRFAALWNGRTADGG